MLNAITKKEYSEICWPGDFNMQKFCEKEVFEVVPLTDGYAAVEKSNIKTEFCFGYGWNGADFENDQERADRMARDARTFDYFKAENMHDIKRRVENLEKALNAENGVFDFNNCYAVIGIRQHYTGEKLSRVWSIVDSSYYYGEITAENIIKNARYGESYRLATREEIQALLDAEKRQAAAFEKRLGTWWKRYGAEKLTIWSFLRD